MSAGLLGKSLVLQNYLFETPLFQNSLLLNTQTKTQATRTMAYRPPPRGLQPGQSRQNRDSVADCMTDKPACPPGADEERRLASSSIGFSTPPTKEQVKSSLEQHRRRSFVIFQGQLVNADELTQTVGKPFQTSRSWHIPVDYEGPRKCARDIGGLLESIATRSADEEIASKPYNPWE